MITQKTKEEAMIKNASFIKQVEDYKQLLADNKLPLLVDINEIRVGIKAQLFQKLIAVDKGLKMRLDMLMSEEAKLALINSSIDLTGYPIIDTFKAALVSIEAAYNKVFVSDYDLGLVHRNIPLAKFANLYSLNLEDILNKYLIDWKGKEDTLAKFESTKKVFAELMDIYKKTTVSPDFNIQDMFEDLKRIFEQNEVGSIEVNEKAIYYLAESITENGKA